MTLFLTQVELHELTDLVQPAAQMRWLTTRGWPFEVSAKGKPRVLRLVMEQKMGLPATKSRQQRTEPNFTALQELIEKPRNHRKPSS